MGTETNIKILDVRNDQIHCPLYSLLEVCRAVLLECGAHGDLGHYGHGGPLLGLLPRVEGLGGEAGVVGAVGGHLGGVGCWWL